jgi:hypothetical protein
VRPGCPLQVVSRAFVIPLVLCRLRQQQQQQDLLAAPGEEEEEEVRALAALACSQKETLPIQGCRNSSRPAKAGTLAVAAATCRRVSGRKKAGTVSPQWAVCTHLRWQPAPGAVQCSVVPGLHPPCKLLLASNSWSIAYASNHFFAHAYLRCAVHLHHYATLLTSPCICSPAPCF